VPPGALFGLMREELAHQVEQLIGIDGFARHAHGSARWQA